MLRVVYVWQLSNDSIKSQSRLVVQNDPPKRLWGQTTRHRRRLGLGVFVVQLGLGVVVVRLGLGVVLVQLGLGVVVVTTTWCD